MNFLTEQIGMAGDVITNFTNGRRTTKQYKSRV